MNQSAPTSQPTQSRDLNAAILGCFSTRITSPPFEHRLVELTAALTTAKDVTLWAEAVEQDAEPGVSLLQAAPQATPSPEAQEAALSLLSEAKPDAPQLTIQTDMITASIALPAGRTAALCVGLPKAGQMTRSLAYERITLLANLSFQHNRHNDLVAQSQMADSLRQIGAGDDAPMQTLVDQLSQLTGADYCACGLYRAGQISGLVVSGQENFTKRAQLPSQLKAAMLDAAQKRLSTPHIAFAQRRGGSEDGLVLSLENPRRNRSALSIAAALYAQSATRPARSRWTRARFTKWAAAILVAIGVAMVPLPDGVDISASVEALDKRIITAPLNTQLAEVLVTDSQRVIGGETVLARLDTGDIDLDLIAARSEYATAILDRETARAARNAAMLRNAELEVERIDAQVRLLEFQKTQAAIIAPISGIAVLDGLDEREGSTLRAGDSLMQVVDPEALYLDLAISETQIGKIAQGQSGVFRPDFDPRLRLPATISEISPALSLTQEVPLIPARAQFEGPAEAMRFGLKGTYSVDRAYRPAWSILYDNIRDWVLLRFWL